MSNFVITACSTSDLWEDYTKERNIQLFPYSYILSGKEYSDDFGKSMPIKTFYQRVRDGEMPSTSMINVQTYTDYFEPILASGKDILHIEFSSGLSGSCSNAKNAAKELNGKYPNQIYVVDSLCASLGYGLLVHYALNLRDEGKSLEEIRTWLEENKLRLNHWFTVDDLNHLKRGGRVSGVTAFLGTMLSIKPVLNVDDDGHLIPREKARGRKKAIVELVNKMKERIVDPDGQMIFICQGDCIDDAEFLAAKIKETFPGVLDVKIGYTGPVIGAHSGPGTLAVFFMGDRRQ